MSLYIKAEDNTQLDSTTLSIMEKLRKFWAEHPLPPPTGEVADKAFFDDLSGET